MLRNAKKQDDPRPDRHPRHSPFTQLKISDGLFFVCLRFYGPANTIQIMSSQSVNLLTLFLDLQSGYVVPKVDEWQSATAAQLGARHCANFSYLLLGDDVSTRKQLC